MAGSTNKKVIVERFDREALRGFVNPQTWLREDGIELLTSTGSVVSSRYEEIKAVFFVQDLDTVNTLIPKRIFTTRPKSEGLWVRMLFRDGDYMDGLLANNLRALDAYGFSVVPPDPSANNQRVYVPKAALSDLKVLGVIGSPLKRRKRVPPSKDQISLFE